MRLARRVAAGLLLGALIGFLAALLRPRSVHNAAPVGRAGRARAGLDAAPPPERPAPSSRVVIGGPETRPLTLPASTSPRASGGTA